MIAQYARTENAHCEEVTAQISISSKNASDRLVAVFFCGDVDGDIKGQLLIRMRRRDADGLPFLATMFHAVGLNVIDPRERKRDVLDVSTRALRDMIAMSWLRTTLSQQSHDTQARPKLYVDCPHRCIVCTSRHPDIYYDSWYWAS